MVTQSLKLTWCITPIGYAGGVMVMQFPCPYPYSHTNVVYNPDHPINSITAAPPHYVFNLNAVSPKPNTRYAVGVMIMQFPSYGWLPSVLNL